MSPKNISLIGFMGCGKSTIGRALAKLLFEYSFVDMDKEIELDANMSISEIFSRFGEERFRELEHKNAVELGKKEGLIIACGGGVIKNDKNIGALKQNGIVLYLKASPEHIFKNLENDNDRPLLQGGDKKEKIKTLMNERSELYIKSADIIFDISGLWRNKAAEEILAFLKKEGIV